MKTETENLRELDVWIAEHLFGYRWFLLDDGITQLEIPAEWLKRYGAIMQDKPDGEIDIGSAPHYSTDSAAAMLVLEKCIENGYTPLLSRAFHSNEQRDLFSCRNGDMGDEYASAETLPIAICKFAKALYSK